jgi:hypothetical protein
VLAAKSPAGARPAAAELALMRGIALDIREAVGNPLKRSGDAPDEALFGCHLTPLTLGVSS